MKSEGTFAKYGKGGYARVLIEIVLGGEVLSVEIMLNDDEWNNQLRTGDFDYWLEGAVYGVQFALRVAGVTAASVEIKRIVGLMVDTIPTNIAAAAADAVWKAINFDVPKQITHNINQAVLIGWKNPHVLQKFD